MKKFNKLQQTIIREEFARAAMIQKAKKTLNEHRFNFFINELRNYENNFILTESNQNELMYEGLKKQLELNESAMERLKNLGRGFLDKIAPDNQKKLEQLADELDMLLKGELEAGKELGDLAGNEAIKVKAAGLIDQMRAISPEAANAAAEAYGIGAKGSSGGGDTPDAADMAKDPKAKAAADKIEAMADARASDMENPKAGGIFSSIVDSYKYAFAANAKMWKNVFGFFVKTKKAPAPKQDDMILQLLMMLLKQQQAGNMAGAPNAGEVKKDVKDVVKSGSDEETAGDETGDAPVITIRSIQRPIINVVQRVSAAQGVDVTVKQAQEIAIAITKNLADQMRANGVSFKGDKPKTAEAKPEEETRLVAEVLKADNSNIRSLFFKNLSYMINEERLSGKYGLKKKFKSKNDAKLPKNYKYGKVGVQDYLKTYKAVAVKYKQMALKSKESHMELKDTDNADNYVDYYDMYLDLVALRQFGSGTLYSVKQKIKKFDTPDGKNNAKLTKLEDLEGDMVDAKNDVDTMIKRYTLHGDVTRPGIGKEMKRKYIKLKKETKGMGGKKEKAATKDLSMADAEKGKVNISKTVAKAVQAGGLSPDVAKKITPILKKKVQGIIAKHMDGDVKYLEEKINRYVQAVIQEVK